MKMTISYFQFLEAFAIYLRGQKKSFFLSTFENY